MKGTVWRIGLWSLCFSSSSSDLLADRKSAADVTPSNSPQDETRRAKSAMALNLLDGQEVDSVRKESTKSTSVEPENKPS